MNVQPRIPAGTVCFTNRLAGATLDELLERAAQNWWPEHSLEREWDLLRNWAFQTECLQTDEAENVAWEKSMRALMGRELPYADFVAERMALLEARLRSRKLQQSNLRYKYGFKPTKAPLVRRNVRRFFDAWSDPGVD